VGNVLWEAGEISAVLDWEEAACGDPVIDVAYARMNMYLMGLPEAADEFLHAYEGETGHPVENLAIWEMAAAARPMDDLEAWNMDQEIIAGRFQRFMEEAIKRN
jgi:aminoglycoside phosphotransferase (APT) family kinase protein